MVVTRGLGSRGNGEIFVKVYKLPVTKLTSSGGLCTAWQL